MSDGLDLGCLALGQADTVDQVGPSPGWVQRVQPMRPLAGWLVTMAFVTTSWIFFRMTSLNEAVSFTQAAWNLPAGFTSEARAMVSPGIWRLLATFVIVQVPLQRLIDAVHRHQLHISWRLVLSGWLLLLGVIMSAGESFDFIYFEF